ncbi:hypothetical protein NQ317_001406 [Molorchus minor]|uniref:Uncharacterized protein n=1 Tax=Molorchus minor TaxID=1323400 RepID=A0ABQ9JX88_9CUCU|nr:hypothetical protein NQ317_001406 [Molorchus minor]
MLFYFRQCCILAPKMADRPIKIIRELKNHFGNGHFENVAEYDYRISKLSLIKFIFLTKIFNFKIRSLDDVSNH